MFSRILVAHASCTDGTFSKKFKRGHLQYEELSRKISVHAMFRLRKVMSL